ncbi:MAG: hypothetical protein JSR27_10970 [Proteobacteria bacterium]|nr:hypothetical protein [Pseudomonadota bacterium]
MKPERVVVPIALPSLAQHWREFTANRGAWLVLARNLVPVFGIYGFGWSVALTVFNYWFDGLVAVAAIIAALIPRALRESRKPRQKPDGPILALVRGVVTWAFLLAVLGTPYWITLIPLHDMLLAPSLLAQIAHGPGLWATFGMIAVMHFRRAFSVGYDTMPETDLKQRARWDLYLLLLRAVAMFTLAGGIFVIVLVPLLAMLFSYMEIWPERALGLVFGDPRRLHELDPDKDS